MEFTDALMGFWNGLTAWAVMIVHLFGGWPGYPVYDAARQGNWYDFGFLVGAGSPFFGALGAGSRRKIVVVERLSEPSKVSA
jgi:hypothetical protein